jgi:hypothetical protein
MRRLARHLFTLCSAVSLLLCVAVCVLWVRSYVRKDELKLVYRSGRQFCAIASNRGVLAFGWGTAGRPARLGWDYDDVDADHGWESFGLRFGFGHYTTRSEQVLFAPHAALVTAIGLAVGVPRAYQHRIYARRAKRGLCRVCGYDLRASPERCPECGTPAA